MGVQPGTCLCLIIFFYAAYGFNIDTKYAIFKETPNGNAYFGYSVAQHSISDGVNTNFDQILVGAPRARSSDPLLNSFEETGALYRCPIDLTSSTRVDDCRELPYPETESLKSDISANADVTENKTGMWLGVNIRSSGPGQFIVACGHRYRISEANITVYGLGVCYKYNADYTLHGTRPSEMPCAGYPLIAKNVYTEFGVCAAGMGLAAADKDIIYGAPGSGTWRGSLLWYRKNPFPLDSISFMLDPTPEEGADPPTKSFSYLGSSAIIVRNLLDDSRKVTVVGAPGDVNNGSVLVIELYQDDGTLIVREKYFGDQFRSGFGHSVAVVDIKNDRHPSMVVGAPFYRPESGEDVNQRSTVGGAVYVYYNYGNGIVPNTGKVMLLPGVCQPGNVDHCINSQFGYAVNSVGDLNGDGFHDLAVGAPFYGNGAVFIYNGQSDGKFPSEPSQVIMPTDLESSHLTRPISGFGISLSGGYNMDNQGYTDIIVGAHASSHVTVLRSRPVVTITGSIKLNNTKLDPNNTVCLSETSSPKACIDFITCFQASFSGDNSNDGAPIEIKYTLTGDSGYEYANNRRVAFSLSNAKNLDSVKTDSFMTIVDGQERCILQKIYIPYMKDLLKAVEFEMVYELVLGDSIVFNNINTYPIMDIFANTKPTAKIDFKRECRTPRCETDLGVVAMFSDRENVIEVEESERTSNDQYVFDSNKLKKLDLTVKLTVDSDLDRAYEPHVYIFLESELRYSGIAKSIPQEDETTTSCSQNDVLNVIICAFGRTILNGEKREVMLTLSFDDLGPTFTTINITANTTSEDTSPVNNFASLQVKANIVTDLELLGGVTKGESVQYGSGEIKGATAMEKDSEIGDLVQHTYTILNHGYHGEISRVLLVVQWPYEIAESGKYLLYMTTSPQRITVPEGKGQCLVRPDYINKLKLEVVDVENDNESGFTVRRKREAGKRTAAVRTEQTTDGKTQSIADLNCYDKTATCFNITCEFLKVRPREEIKVRFNSRLWNSSLTQDFGRDVELVRIRSSGHLFIDADAKVSQTNYTNDGANVTTDAEPDFPPIEKEPIWIIALAAVGGLVLLIIIIIIFWKCGFFKRSRPMTYGVKVEKQKETGASYKQVPQNDPDNTMTKQCL